MVRQYECGKCGSKYLFMKKSGNHTGLYCSYCGSWLKWVGKKEIRVVERFIESEREA